MTAFSWLVYALVFVSGVVYLGMSATERAFERATVPQMLYLMYLMTLSVFAGMAMRDAALALLFAAIPAAVAAWFAFSSGGSADFADAAAWEARRREIAAALEADPSDVLALDARADLLAQIGEADAALTAYGALVAAYESRTGYGRLLSAARGRMEQLRLGGSSCARDQRLPRLLRACPGCGAVIARRGPACPSCGRAQHGGPLAWRLALVEHGLAGLGLKSVSFLGVLFLPFLFLCGPIAYGLVWAVWALGLSSRREAPPPFGSDPGRALRELLAQGAAVAVLLAGYAGYAAPPARASSPRTAAVERAPAEAESRGELGPVAAETLARYRGEALSISARADALAARSRRAQAAAGASPDDAFAAAAPALIERLSSSSEQERLEAAQLLCDVRVAANAPQAEAPLERLALSDPSEDVRSFAALALKRVRFCASNDLCAAKWKAR